MDRTPISDLAGALAVGSIGFAGAFLIVDGINGLFLLIEEYAQTTTWAVLFAAPTLVLAYAFGVVAMQVTGFVRTAYDVRRGRDPLASFVNVAKLNNEHIVNRYLELRRSQEFLQGVSPSLALLGVGLFFAIRWMGAFYLFGYIAGAGCLALSVLLPALADRLALQSFSLAEHADKALADRAKSAA
jgi:hypothetical protein